MEEKETSNLLKKLIILGIIFNIFLFGILPLIYLSQRREVPSIPRDPIYFGSKYIAKDIDPHYCSNCSAINAITMVWEGLLAINFSHPEMTLYPLLATDLGTYDATGTELTFNLKMGVRFHDGIHFNADAVVWSFNRLHYLMNVSGTLPNTVLYNRPTIIRTLYEWPDGTPIINHTEAVNNTRVKFVLNRPYGPFRALLTFPASAILSPFSTPQLDYINPAEVDVPGAGNPLSIYGPCIGTGPMMIEKLETYEVRFYAFQDYHQPMMNFDVLVHIKIQDDDVRNMYLISGMINFITDPSPEYLEAIEAEEEVTLYEAGYDATIQYLGFNNKLYNTTWRKAISWSLDYESIINQILKGEAIRLKSPIPLGILFANWSFSTPILNFTKARQYMNQMGYGIGFTSDAEWETVAASSTPFLTLNYTYNLDNEFQKEVHLLLQNNLSKIGVKVIDAGMTEEEYIDRLSNERKLSAGWDALQLFWTGWWPYFNDPSTYINSLMSNTSLSNSAQINDPTLEDYILIGLQETDQNKRKQLYWDLQRYVVEELCPFAFCYVEKNYDAWDKDLHGFPSNAMEIPYFYPCYWV
ncbi:MAG: ABC transporter substrate-binding protein [Candidatus Odinarchaeota archaeon]